MNSEVKNLINQARTYFNKYDAIAWYLTAATVFVALAVGFFVHGGLHGQYMDDYFIKTWAFNFARHKWQLTLVPHPPGDPISLRPLVYLLTPNLANLLPDHELPLRLGIVIIHLINTLLLGKLAERLTKSMFVGLITGACFLFPVLANEGLLWVTAAIADTLSLLLLLIGFHLILSCRSVREDVLLLLSGIAIWILGIMFYEPGILTLLLLPFCFGMLPSGREKSNRRPWIAAIAGAYLPLSLYAVYVGKNSHVIAQRGGISLDPGFIFHKIPDVTRNVIWLMTDWGISGPIRDALMLGWHEWSATIGGIALVIALILGLCLVSALFPIKEPLELQEQITGNLRVTLIGLAWMVMGLFPVLIVRAQIVEIRALYTPFAGVALCIGALLGLLADSVGRWRKACIRIVLAMTGAAVFSSSVAMAGLVRAYELRWHLDEQQITAVKPILASFSNLQPLWLMPVALDERILPESPNTSVLNRYLFGVFEHSASAEDALLLKFGDRDVRVIAAQHWDRLHVTALRTQDGPRGSEIIVQGQAVPIGRLIAFTYRRGQVILLDPIEIDGSNHNSATVKLPLINHIAGTRYPVEKVSFQLE